MYLAIIGGFALTGLGTGSTINLRAFGLLSLAVLALTACRGKEFVPDAKFVDLYVELKMATVGYGTNLEKVNEARRVILAQHHETPNGFHTQYAKLMSHPESWRKFQDDVIKQVDSFQATHQVDKVDSTKHSATVKKVETSLKGK